MAPSNTTTWNELSALKSDITEIRADQQAINDKLDIVCELLQGNGDPTKSLVVRVDRLEVVAARNSKARHVFVGAVLAIISSLVGALVKSLWK